MLLGCKGLKVVLRTKNNLRIFAGVLSRFRQFKCPSFVIFLLVLIGSYDYYGYGLRTLNWEALLG